MMSCRGCGDKPSRYAVKSGDIDRSAQLTQKDPFMEFVASKGATYEELVERQRIQLRMAEQQHNQMLAEMTDAMRRKYVDELVSVANADKMGAPGISPDQAVVTLMEVLDRPDFSFISTVYPKLRSAVVARYEKIKSSAIPLN